MLAWNLKLPYRSYREGCNENVGDDVDSGSCKGEPDNELKHIFNHLENDTHAFESMHFAVSLSLRSQNADTGMQEKTRTRNALVPAAIQMAPTM